MPSEMGTASKATLTMLCSRDRRYGFVKLPTLHATQAMAKLFNLASEVIE
jgi:hypothetical protein